VPIIEDKDELVQKIKCKQTEGRTRPIALLSSPTLSENIEVVAQAKTRQILGGSESAHLGYNPAHSQRPVGVGMEGDWIGFGVRLCLMWGMKIVGYEKAGFSQICK